MKKLIIVRHAKAENLQMGKTDFERKLSEIGKNEAAIVAKKISDKIPCPHLFISSDAKRAFSTAKRFAAAFNVNENDIIIEHKIYEATLDTLVNVVQQLNEKVESAIIFGHNPGLSQLVFFLATNGGIELPTCGVIVMQFQLNNWVDIAYGTGKIIHFDRP